MGIAITIFVLFLIIGIFIYHDHTEWRKFASKTAATGLCPFCGLRLHRFDYEDKKGAYTAFSCPSCEFSVSLKKEDLDKIN